MSILVIMLVASCHHAKASCAAPGPFSQSNLNQRSLPSASNGNVSAGTMYTLECNYPATFNSGAHTKLIHCNSNGTWAHLNPNDLQCLKRFLLSFDRLNYRGEYYFLSSTLDKSGCQNRCISDAKCGSAEFYKPKEWCYLFATSRTTNYMYNDTKRDALIKFANGTYQWFNGKANHVYEFLESWELLEPLDDCVNKCGRTVGCIAFVWLPSTKQCWMYRDVVIKPFYATHYKTTMGILDHLQEINHKLTQLDDEIWGKIVLMERNKRIAKAYLRTTTVVVDGSCFGFDGRTIGFNSFENPFRDAHIEELRSKIGEGVILKMDFQGNIIAMARGTSPVFVQGAKSHDAQCYSEKVAKLKGRLETADRRDEQRRDRAVKVFDMKVFKTQIERELHQPYPNRKELLFKTCIRISLVKDDSHALKTPCWFMIVNLVALDMLNAKVSAIPGAPSPPSSAASGSPNSFLNRRQSEGAILSANQHLSQSTTDLYGTLGPQATAPTALERLLATNPQLAMAAAGGNAWAAAQLQQALHQTAAAPPLDHLAQLANSLALGYDPNSVPTKRTVWKPTPSGYLSESESTVLMRRPHGAEKQQKLRPLSAGCRWGVAQSMDSLYEPIDVEDDDVAACGSSAARMAARAGKTAASVQNFSLRTKQQFSTDASAPAPSVSGPKKLFPPNGTYGSLKPATWSNGSTSDYESTKDIYDSFSSSSRSSNSANGRSTSPSIISEAASESQTSDSGYIETTAKTMRHSRTLDQLTTTGNKPKHHIIAQPQENHLYTNAPTKPVVIPQKKPAPLPPTPTTPTQNQKPSLGGMTGAAPTAQNGHGTQPKLAKPRRLLKPSLLLQHYRNHLGSGGTNKGSSALGTINSDLSSSSSETEIYRL